MITGMFLLNSHDWNMQDLAKFIEEWDVIRGKGRSMIRLLFQRQVFGKR